MDITEENICIKNTEIGDGASTYIIAEMSANHGGSKSNAKKIIRAAKEAGADCIKTQTYTPDTMTIDCNKDYFQIENEEWGGLSLYDLYDEAYTPWEWQSELKDLAEDLGLDFLSTPYEKTAVDFLEDLKIDFYKISSFSITNIPFLKYVASKEKPIIMSTGMATLGEIEEAVNTIKNQGNDKLALMKCNSGYPAVHEEMNLKTIKNLKNTFGCPVGLSDHSLGSISSITSIGLGADIIEKHMCLDRDMNTPDSSFSMEPNEFKQMVNDIRKAEKAIGKIKYGPSKKEKSSKIFRRSIFAVKNIEKGEKITRDNIRIIRPNHGLEPKHYNDIIGKKASKSIQRGTPLEWDLITG